LLHLYVVRADYEPSIQHGPTLVGLVPPKTGNIGASKDLTQKPLGRIDTTTVGEQIRSKYIVVGTCWQALFGVELRTPRCCS
jgi:hypothetical protein